MLVVLDMFTLVAHTVVNVEFSIRICHYARLRTSDPAGTMTCVHEL